jgi:L-lactate dehydrogenase
VELLRAIAFDQKRILPVSTLMEGTLGMSDVALSLPTVIGRGGRERVLEPVLDAQESAALQGSYRVLREAVESVGL